MCEIRSKLTIKTPKWRRARVSVPIKLQDSSQQYIFIREDTLAWRLPVSLLLHFTLFSIVFIVEFEHVIVCCKGQKYIKTNSKSDYSIGKTKRKQKRFKKGIMIFFFQFPFESDEIIPLHWIFFYCFPNTIISTLIFDLKTFRQFSWTEVLGSYNFPDVIVWCFM